MELKKEKQPSVEVTNILEGTEREEIYIMFLRK